MQVSWEMRFLLEKADYGLKQFIYFFYSKQTVVKQLSGLRAFCSRKKIGIGSNQLELEQEIVRWDCKTSLIGVQQVRTEMVWAETPEMRWYFQIPNLKGNVDHLSRIFYQKTNKIKHNFKFTS